MSKYLHVIVHKWDCLPKDITPLTWLTPHLHPNNDQQVTKLNNDEKESIIELAGIYSQFMHQSQGFPG